MTIQQFRFLYNVLIGKYSTYYDIVDDPWLRITMRGCRKHGWLSWASGEDDRLEVTLLGVEQMKVSFPEFFQ